MKKSLILSVMLSVYVLSACDNSDHPVSVPQHQEPVVKAIVAGYSGTGLALDGENAVKDLQACVFHGGRMTAVFEDIPTSGGAYEIKVGGYKGNMYVMANAGNQLNLDSLKGSGITEAEWLRLTLATERGAPVHFFSGSVSLASAGQTEIPVTLKRGVARFDLRLRTAGEASVSAVTFRNLAQSVYLFPVDGEYSPAGADKGVATVSFTQPLTADTPAVMYVYEQTNAGIEVEVNAVIDGKPVVLKKTLSGNLSRNTIYTLTVRKDDIDVSLDITFEEWEEGSDTELTPVVRHI